MMRSFQTPKGVDSGKSISQSKLIYIAPVSREALRGDDHVNRS